MPTKFEKALLDTAVSAQEFHKKMAWGNYLTYSHESYLQNYIAIKMNDEEHDYPVYIDTTPKKIYDWRSDEMPSDIRFDLTFWWKDKFKESPRALVEIKRAWSMPPIIKDIKKIMSFCREYDNQVSGYVLYLTGTIEKEEVQKAVQLIIRRFNKVNVEMRNKLGLPGLVHSVDSHIYESGNHAWGFALYRAWKPKPRRPCAPVAP